MNGEWWCNKKWCVRREGKLSYVLHENDEFWLEPNTMESTPTFFWWRFADYSGHHNCWRDAYFYQVGDHPHPVPMLPAWDPKVEKVYEIAAADVRRAANNPYTARLEGHILVDHKWEIVRLLFFQGVQEDGRDWVVVDALVSDGCGLSIDEDGTAHGDPK